MNQKNPVATDEASPEPMQGGRPAFSQAVDSRRGCVRVQGDLTSRTADQLRGTVDALRRGGLTGVIVDCRGLRSTDQAGLESMRAMQAAVDADGGYVSVLAFPPRPPHSATTEEGGVAERQGDTRP